MKILFLVSSMHAGGAERVAATLASAWAERGDAVTLVPTYTGKGSCFYPLSPKVKLLWLADYLHKSRNPLLAGIGKLRALRKLVHDEQPGIIVSFLTNVNVVALIATYGLSVPVIVCERTNPAASTSSGALLKFLRRLTYRRASVVTVQAQSSVEPFKKMVPGIRCLEVIPNPLPPELLDVSLAERAPDSRGRYHLVAMGRLVPAKQFELLIRVFSELAADYPEWDLVIWGEGPLRGDLNRLAASAGLASRVMLPGRTEAPWAELAKAHAFVLTSAVEGFPNVLLEAMAIGLPCVTFDCPSGPREMTRDGGDALLVPAGDQAALAGSLRRVLGDAPLRNALAQKGALSVRQRYALPVVLEKWDTLIRQAGVHSDKENL
ncbi:MAG TPA: glycosyltransferase family 4 protein [Eoetvoesiella sp.]